jgi:cation:H+ antiporter
VNESLGLAVGYFSVASAATVAFGIRITLLADQIAQRTQVGRVLIGAILLGALTSVAEVGTSITAALQNHPALAVHNAVGSIAAQTAFLAVADLAYRRANLEHAAASESNLMLNGLLLLLLGILLLAVVSPTLSLAGSHPVSWLLPACYLYGMRLVARSGEYPMWDARRTRETGDDAEQSTSASGSLSWLFARFAAFAALLVASGALLAESGVALTLHTGLSESFVGALLTGVVSSAPELVTAITAVRIGAVSLAVSNIIGGNTFDTLIVALADWAYPGSIFQGTGSGLAPLLTATLLMNTVLLMGLIRRERHGIGNIGMEGALLLVLYSGVVVGLSGQS